MAKHHVIVLRDDLDGSDATETIRFSFDGANYSIDLNEEHAREMREVFGRYINAAERVRRGGRRRSTGTGFSKEKLAAIREWANARGYNVSPRGRIRQDIVDEYEQEHN